VAFADTDDLIVGREFYAQRLEKPVLYLDAKYGLIQIDTVTDTEDGGLFLTAWKVKPEGKKCTKHRI
jgi:hypothetical protein